MLPITPYGNTGETAARYKQNFCLVPSQFEIENIVWVCVFHFGDRRDILRHLNTNLEEELEYTEIMIMKNSKNYQVWHHRRVMVELIGNGENELEMTEHILELDAKNYHAWQHRQWAIKTYK